MKKCNQKNAALREAIERAKKAENELSFAVQEVERTLVFEGFDEDDLPIVSMCNGGELILVYEECEIQANEYVEYMEKHGCITPELFYKYIKFEELLKEETDD